MKLTKTLVEGAAPKATRYRLNDSLVPGLSLLAVARIEREVGV